MLLQKPREAVYISIKTKGKQAKGKNVIKKQNKKLYKQKKRLTTKHEFKGTDFIQGKARFWR